MFRKLGVPHVYVSRVASDPGTSATPKWRNGFLQQRHRINLLSVSVTSELLVKIYLILSTALYTGHIVKSTYKLTEILIDFRINLVLAT
jgi:hypothetical protein